MSAHAAANDVTTWLAGRPAAAAAACAAAASAGSAAYSTTWSAHVAGVSGSVSDVQVPDGSPLRAPVVSSVSPLAPDRNRSDGSSSTW